MGNIDSLRNVFYSTSIDSVKLLSAKALSARYESKNPDSAVYFGEQALILARDLKRPLDEVSALLKMGAGYFFAREYNKSIDKCNKAFELSNQINDTVYKGNILYYLSRSYSRIARYDLTIQAQLDAIRFFEERNNNAAIGVMYNNMSIAYKYLGDHEAAIQALRAAYKFYRESQFIDSYFSPLINIAASYYEMKEYDSCRVYVDSARMMAKEYNMKKEPNILNHMEIWLGNLAYVKEDYKKSLRTLQSQLEGGLGIL